jgi:hypothetical protein
MFLSDNDLCGMEEYRTPCPMQDGSMEYAARRDGFRGISRRKETALRLRSVFERTRDPAYFGSAIFRVCVKLPAIQSVQRPRGIKARIAPTSDFASTR